MSFFPHVFGNTTKLRLCCVANSNLMQCNKIMIMLCCTNFNSMKLRYHWITKVIIYHDFIGYKLQVMQQTIIYKIINFFCWLCNKSMDWNTHTHMKRFQCYIGGEIWMIEVKFFFLPNILFTCGVCPNDIGIKNDNDENVGGDDIDMYSQLSYPNISRYFIIDAVYFIFL